MFLLVLGDEDPDAGRAAVLALLALPVTRLRAALAAAGKAAEALPHLQPQQRLPRRGALRPTWGSPNSDSVNGIVTMSCRSDVSPREELQTENKSVNNDRHSAEVTRDERVTSERKTSGVPAGTRANAMQWCSGS